jgi:hypothetical protein
MIKQKQKLQSVFCSCLKMKNSGIISFFHTAIYPMPKDPTNKMSCVMVHIKLKCVSDSTVVNAHEVPVLKLFFTLFTLIY